MRWLLLAIAFLVGCAETPMIRAPRYLPDGTEITYRVAYLDHYPADAVALVGQGVTLLSPSFGDLPEYVKTFVVYHELCHHAGIENETAADVCALYSMRRAGHLGLSTPALIAAHYLHGQAERAGEIMRNAP